MKNPGKLVRTKSGKLGRTYDFQKSIDGKIRVYKCSEHNALIPMKYSDKPVLCRLETLTVIGFID